MQAGQLASKMQALGPFQSNLVVPSNDPSANNPLVQREEAQANGDGRDMVRIATRRSLRSSIRLRSLEACSLAASWIERVAAQDLATSTAFHIRLRDLLETARGPARASTQRSFLRSSKAHVRE